MKVREFLKTIDKIEQIKPIKNIGFKYSCSDGFYRATIINVNELKRALDDKYNIDKTDYKLITIEFEEE